jgi:hypothetical protein
MTRHSILIATLVSLSLVLLSNRPSVLASPVSSYRPVVVMQPQVVQPYFPICAKGYPSISSCAQAAPALPNASAVRMCRSRFSLFLIPLLPKGHLQPGCVHRRDSAHARTPFNPRFRSVPIGARVPPRPTNTLSKTFNCSLLSSYEKMNQMAVLNTSNLPSLVNSIR